MLKKFYEDEYGFVVSIELMLIATLAFCAAIVGFTAIRNSLANELNDVAKAIAKVDQSYEVGGITLRCGEACMAYQAGFGFNDSADECDASVIEVADVCGDTSPPPSEGE